MPVVDETTFEVSHKGPVSRQVLDEALAKITDSISKTREKVHHVDLRLTMVEDTHRETPAIAEVSVVLDGRPIRAQAANSSPQAAVDILVDRLSRRIQDYEDRLHRTSERYRKGEPADGEWRHGDGAASGTRRADYANVPIDERDIRRHKTLAMEPMSLAVAAFDREMLDHDFYLFLHEASGADAIVARDRDPASSKQLIQFSTGRPTVFGDHPEDTVEHMEVVETVPAALALAEAITHLDTSGDPWVFFLSPENGRGRVLYRRYDGHYGLVLPSDSAD